MTRSAPRLITSLLSPTLLCLALTGAPSAATASPEPAPSSEAAAGTEAAAEKSASTAPDWPQFRGPRGDGAAAGDADPWLGAAPKELWRTSLGKGYSGISAVSGTLFTQASLDGEEFLIAKSAETGQDVWRLRIDSERRDQFGDGPRSTPTVHGDRVYAVSAFGKLWAADRERGRALWHHDLRERFGAVVPTWGVSTAPVVVDDLLLLNVGGKPGHALMAFDAGSGEVRWSVESGIPGYALPITYTALGQRQTVFFTGKRLIAIDPADGRTLWTRAWKTAYDVNAAAPIFLEPDRLFVSSGYDTGASLFQLEREDGELGVRELWRSRKMKNQFSASVYHDGHFYGFDNKNLRCLDAASGEVAWTTKGFGHGSLMLVDGHLVILGERGKLALAEASAKGYRELWTHSVARGKHWTVPTLYAGRLYIRNEKELMAFAPAAPAGASG